MDGQAERFVAPAPARVASSEPGSSVSRLRSLYLLAVSDESAIDRGLEEVQRLRAQLRPAERARMAGTLTAYEGALMTLRAKHALWPPAKLRHLREGLKVLDATVAKHPEDTEVRYLRLMSCFYLPAVLGRKQSVREDFDALARLLPREHAAHPGEMYRAIVRFVLQEGDLTTEQRGPLERALKSTE